MKLDESVIEKIIEEGVVGTVDESILKNELRNLNLVFKLGDSSQSVLVDSEDR